MSQIFYWSKIYTVCSFLCSSIFQTENAPYIRNTFTKAQSNAEYLISIDLISSSVDMTNGNRIKWFITLKLTQNRGFVQKYGELKILHLKEKVDRISKELIKRYNDKTSINGFNKLKFTHIPTRNVIYSNKMIHSAYWTPEHTNLL